MILGLLQARMSSSRLPEKVLKPVIDSPMLYRQLERLKRANKLDQLIVVTSDTPSDDRLAEECLKWDMNVTVFRGSLNNVLDRFYQCAKEYNVDHIVRLTGDCPLTDPHIIDDLIELHVTENNDYSSNCHQRSYPVGLDAEIVRFETLETIWKLANTPDQKEHVTLYINQHPDQFKRGLLTYPSDLSTLRWTVDNPDDLIFVQKVYEALYPKNPNFTMNDILALLDNQPELLTINSHIKPNADLVKSFS